MIAENLRPADILSEGSFRNAIRMLQAIGGSTNAVIHLAAMAGRLGIQLKLEDFNQIGDEIPMIVDLKPSGQYYMEDLHRSGGVPGIISKLGESFERDCSTVTGNSIQENLSDRKLDFPQDIIRNGDDPIYPRNAIAALTGNLAPDGAVIKLSSATAELLNHTGRAVVFNSLDDLAERIDLPELGIKADDILVLRNAGPVGAPGMPEAGFLPIPKYLGRQGVRDMVRISDARMSGTAFGTIVLHVAPDAASGGPLALVQNGDRIKVSVKDRRLELLVDESELDTPRQALAATLQAATPTRGYQKLYYDSVLQADGGCDFNFLRST